MWKFLLGLGIGIVLGAAGAVALILVVVVAPRVRAANEEARTSSVISTLQTCRSEIELFKIQHAGRPPAEPGLWAVLTGKSNVGDVAVPNSRGEFGPYVLHEPVNPMNGQSAVGPRPSPGVGWVYRVAGESYTLQAVNERGDGLLPY